MLVTFAPPLPPGEPKAPRTGGGGMFDGIASMIPEKSGGNQDDGDDDDGEDWDDDDDDDDDSD